SSSAFTFPYDEIAHGTEHVLRHDSHQECSRAWLYCPYTDTAFARDGTLLLSLRLVTTDPHLRRVHAHRLAGEGAAEGREATDAGAVAARRPPRAVGRSFRRERNVEG